MKKALLTLALLASAYTHAGVMLNITTSSKNGETCGTVSLEENQTAVLVMSDEERSIEIAAIKKDAEVTIRCVVCQIIEGQSQVVSEEEQTVAADEAAKFKCGCSEDELIIVVVPEEEQNAQ